MKRFEYETPKWISKFFDYTIWFVISVFILSEINPDLRTISDQIAYGCLMLLALNIIAQVILYMRKQRQFEKENTNEN